MHETHLVENIFGYLDKEERIACRRIKRIHISLSEFGGISKEYFRQHFEEKTQGTKWEGLKVEIKKIPYGPELEITRLDFA